MEIINEPMKKDWEALLKRPEVDATDLKETLEKIFSDVKLKGDTALRSYTLEFDKLVVGDFLVREEELTAAIAAVSKELKEAIQVAKQNIESFHKARLQTMQKVETTAGVFCWCKPLPLQSAGLYIPAGTAPLFSTLLMLGIPAVMAGCKEIIVCTPPGKAGKADPVILYVAYLLGIKKIYKVGGAQAIAAMAFGTETIPPVHKIFGPGNRYVTAAKQMLNQLGIAIDMPAGPSELAVYADETCVPAFVAADLLSQAEHGADSQVLLVATTKDIVETVQKEIEMQIGSLPRKDIVGIALQHSRFVIIKNTDTAFDLLNTYAPEHLIIASDEAQQLSEKVINAGSVFLGHYSPESAGDYASGTNHTLPTNGHAKAWSGVSVESFVKMVTFQQLTETGIRNLAPVIQTMAMAEGLEAHARAATIRVKGINKAL